MIWRHLIGFCLAVCGIENAAFLFRESNFVMLDSFKLLVLRVLYLSISGRGNSGLKHMALLRTQGPAAS